MVYRNLPCRSLRKCLAIHGEPLADAKPAKHVYVQLIRYEHAFTLHHVPVPSGDDRIHNVTFFSVNDNEAEKGEKRAFPQVFVLPEEALQANVDVCCNLKLIRGNAPLSKAEKVN